MSCSYLIHLTSTHPQFYNCITRFFHRLMKSPKTNATGKIATQNLKTDNIFTKSWLNWAEHYKRRRNQLGHISPSYLRTLLYYQRSEQRIALCSFCEIGPDRVLFARVDSLEHCMYRRLNLWQCPRTLDVSHQVGSNCLRNLTRFCTFWSNQFSWERYPTMWFKGSRRGLSYYGL